MVYYDTNVIVIDTNRDIQIQLCYKSRGYSDYSRIYDVCMMYVCIVQIKSQDYKCI